MEILPLSNLSYVIVESGDSTWRIAAKIAPWSYGTPDFLPWFTAFAELNGYPKVIYAGQALLVDTTRIPPKPPTLDDILVPPDGKILLGVSLPAGSLATWNTIVGRTPQIAHEYATSANGFQNDLNNTPSGSIPLLNLKPLGSMGAQTYKDVLSGKADPVLDSVANSIGAYGRPLYLAVMHEPENDDKTGASDLDYARAFRYCVEYIRGRGVKFVSVWNMMGYWPNWGSRYDTLYPGDDVVDWIGTDPYCSSVTTSSFKDFVDKGHGFYTWAEPKGKPIMLAEWGIEKTVVGSVAPRLLTQAAVDQLQAEMPLVKALVYWNQVDVGDYLISNMPADFKRFADLPAFQFDIPSDITKP